MIILFTNQGECDILMKKYYILLNRIFCLPGDNMTEEWKQENLNFWAKKPTEEEIFEILEEEGSELLWGAPSELLADRKFMFKAVKKCGLSLEYASDELKNDEKIVLEIERELNLRKDEIIEDEETDTTVDYWIIREDLHVDI